MRIPMATARNVVEALTRCGATLCTAESCTGGGIGAAVTAVPGSSECFVGGIIAYANRAKIGMLGVSPDELDRHGAVSECVAAAMARGARERFGAGLAVSVTGVAGPSGGTDVKPVGLVFIGISCGSGERVERHMFRGNRESVRAQTICAALEMVLKQLAEQGE